MGDGERAAERPLIGELHRRHRATEFRKFLTSIDKAVPAELAVQVMRQPVQVTARVKFPPALIFRLMRTLDEAMSNYEHQFGHITSLGD